MNDVLKEAVLGIMRHGLTVLAGYLVAQGLVDGSDQTLLVSYTVGLTGIGWSIIDKVRRR